MADHDAIIQQFTGMTGASVESARFYLEMTDWDLKAAVSQFYEFSEQPQGESSHPMPDGSLSPSAGATAGVGAGTGVHDAPFFGASAASAASGSSRASSTKKSSSKIRTLGDLGGGQDSDSDNDHQNFFAGGEKSGMVVQGPNKDNDIVSQILKKAAQGGPAPDDEPGQSEKRPNYFTGSGYKLGSDEMPSETIRPPTASPEEQPLEPVTRYLTFWRNGFSVDDGPLYRYDDPANQSMLTAINSGRAPLSLLNVRHGQPVDVRVARRQDEDYVPPPKAPPKPFEGSGYRLGSPSAHVPSSPAASSQTPGSYPAAAVEAPTVDESQPVTQLQIRLGDGSRLVAKFNHNHTIADVRRYIQATRPTEREFVLQTAFPVKPLTNEDQTLKEASLLNAVVVQRYQ